MGAREIGGSTTATTAFDGCGPDLRGRIDGLRFEQMAAAFAPGTEDIRAEVARRVEAVVELVQIYVQQRVAHLDGDLHVDEQTRVKASQDLSIANGTHLIARWIRSGVVSSENEMGSVSFVGRRMAHIHGSAGRVLRGYFAARDAVAWAIAAACDELGVPSAVSEGLLVGARMGYDRSAIQAIGEFDERSSVLAAELERERCTLARLANADPLTGASNRRGLYEHLASLLEHGRSRLRSPGVPAVVVFFVDLDQFKQLNDRFGHRVGDDVLRIVAERLRAAARPADCVARFGGDEFVVVMSGFPDQMAVVEDTAARILVAVRAPIVADGRLVAVTASVGIAQAEEVPVDPDLLIGAADRALYVAKASGGDIFHTAPTAAA